jgi:tetrahydromethanopterin S-methyltransferase subunit F
MSDQESPSERRERIRADLLAQKARERRIEHIGTAVGYILTLIVGVLLAAVVSGALAWLAVWLWTNLPL